MTRYPSVSRQFRPRPRPNPQRQWRGALFGKQVEDGGDYLRRMRELIALPGTHLYFDASFLMLLAKMGKPARDEFVEWTRSVGTTRFHVPLWAGHEFFKHRIDNTLAKELPAEIKRFDNAATDLFSSLQVQASDDLLGFSPGGSLVLDEFKRTVQPLRALLKLVEKSTATQDGVLAIGCYIDELLLSGSIDTLIDDIETDERVRNRGRIPPAFQDANKRARRQDESADGGKDRGHGGDNSFGDLVFWREVLRHAAHVRAKAIVVISKDRKNDWFENYRANDGKTVEIRKRAPRARQIPTPHPMLVREAHDLGAATLDLLDPVYCGILLETIDPAFKSFPAAVLDLHLPDPPSKELSLRNWAARFGPGAQVLGGASATADQEPEEDFDDGQLVQDLLRSDVAPGVDAKPALETLASGEPLARIELLRELDVASLAGWAVADIVAFGRSAAELALTDFRPATQFIENVRDLGPDIPKSVRLPLAFGAIGAAFVTRTLTEAPSKGARAILALLDMVTLPEYSAAASRLADVLGSLGVPNQLRPAGGKVELAVVATPAADGKSPSDLVAIKLEGTNLITEVQPEEELRLSRLLGRGDGQFDTELGPLVDLVSRYNRLPRQLVFVVDADLDDKVRVPEFAGVETED